MVAIVLRTISSDTYTFITMLNSKEQLFCSLFDVPSDERAAGKRRCISDGAIGSFRGIEIADQVEFVDGRAKAEGNILTNI